MSDDRVQLARRLMILMVFAASDQVASALVQEKLRQFQIARLACFAVQLNKPHFDLLMSRDALFFSVAEQVVDAVGEAERDI